MVIFSSIKYVFEDFGILFPALALIALLAVAIIIQHIINRKHDKKEKA